MPGIADSVVQWGYSQIGALYKTGALFTHTAYSVVGVDIPRSAIAQAYRLEELRMPRRDGVLAPGDLVFPTVRIAQLYVGGGMVLTVTPGGVVRLPLRRMTRATRVVTPGGGQGLALARPGFSPMPMVSKSRGVL